MKQNKTERDGQQPMKTSYLLRRFAPYFKKYKGVLALDLFCAGLTTAGELILPLIVRYITDLGMNDMASLTASTILTVGGLYLLLRVVDVMAQYYMANIGHMMGARIETDMRTDFFAHLQELSYSFYDNTKVGQIMARITSDLFDVTEFAHHCPEEYFIALLKVGISFAVLCRYDVWLTLIMFAVLPLMAFCAAAFRSRMNRAFKKSRHQIGELNSQVEDSLLGVRVVKSFANEEVEEEKFRKGNYGFLDIKKEMYKYMAGFQSSTRFFDGVMYIVVVVAGAFFMMYGRIAPADLVAYLMYVSMLLAAVRRIVEFTEQFQRGMTGIERFIEIMDIPIEVDDKEDAVDLNNVKGDVVFDNVYFHYSEEDGDVLQAVNLHVPAGENVALVGPSGGGKSTFCNLLPRFYDVSSGRILVDGKDIKDVTIQSLRSQIGMVQQDVYLFAGSVYENIEYGRPGASREQIMEAAKLAGAHEFIRQLPEGYDTYVGERGVRLSGGQKQRISIARVFLKNPPILILDEATSALDNESERVVQESLEKLTAGRTTFTIAHRLSTIRNASMILVLTEEGIVERGTHAQLMEKQGVYYRMYQLSQRAD